MKQVRTVAATPARLARQRISPSRSVKPIPTMNTTIAGAVLVPGIGIIMKIAITTTSSSGTICIPRPVNTRNLGFTNASVRERNATAEGTNFSRNALENDTFNIPFGSHGVCLLANICNASNASTTPKGML